jgi:3',5'-cyclic AMP phosphodiesterase CpdA
MASVTLLHISDLHISSVPAIPEINRRSPGNLINTVSKGIFAASHSNSKLGAIVNLVNAEQKKLDAIVITGDIATTGLDHDLNKALEFVDGPPPISGGSISGGVPFLGSLSTPIGSLPTLMGTHLPIFLLPGNHDRYKHLLGGLGYAPGGRNFHKWFGGYWTDDVNVNVVTKEDFAVGVIAADFSLRGRGDSKRPKSKNSYAQGKVYPDILQKLKNVTQSFKDENTEKDIFIIWAIHFPPVNPHIRSYMKLIGDDSLVALANRLGVALILSGHTHNPFELSSPKMKFRVLCAGSAAQFDCPEGNHCQIISINNEDEGCWVGVRHFEFDSRTVKFIEV